MLTSGNVAQQGGIMGWRLGTTIESKHMDTNDEPTQRIDSTPTGVMPVQPTAPHQPTTHPQMATRTQPSIATPPPSDGGTPPDTGEHSDRGNGKPLPWSKLAVSSLVLGLLALLCFAFEGFPFAGMLSLIAFPLGVAGLIVIQVRRRRRSTTLAVMAIILSLALFVASVVRTPATSTTATPSPTHSVSAAERAADRSRKAAERKERLLRQQQEREAKRHLAEAKSALTSKLNDARGLLTSSDGNVADPATRDALNALITTDAALNSTNPDDWTSAVQPLQLAMDSVNASEAKKQQDDAAAAQRQAQADADAAKARAEEEQRQQDLRAAQQQAPAPQPQQDQSQQPMGTAHGGAFCTPEGARAQSDRSSRILTCRVAADGRLRWKL
jgi:hypothetical protein